MQESWARAPSSTFRSCSEVNLNWIFGSSFLIVLLAFASPNLVVYLDKKIGRYGQRGKTLKKIEYEAEKVVLSEWARF